jgi:hypothetical protein
MNDLVSEYQQYQDATAEGKFLYITQNLLIKYFSFIFVEEGEGGEEEGEQEGA